MRGGSAIRGCGRSLCVVLAVVAVSLAVAVIAGPARAAPWCGVVAPADRPQVLGGNPIRIIYAIPSDGLDRSAQRAPLISADVDTISDWWRGQDFARAPRFDLATFACGRQADIILVRLPQSAADLAPTQGRFDRIADAVDDLGPDPAASKYLVYYDGPIDDGGLCGQGAGFADGQGVAVVYLTACTDLPTQVTAAHELLHGFGALADTGPPNACPDSRAHPCDSSGDALYPYVPYAQLAALDLDFGRDDYYTHSGSWLDVQDSAWLRHLEAPPAVLSVTSRGGGSVQSNVQGIDCGATCSLEFDGGTQVSLSPSADPGKRFLRWSGACTGGHACVVTIGQAATVAALFAPATFRLAVAVTGKGAVRGASATIACPRRCTATVDSYLPVTLRALPTRGWKLKRWSGGGCSGSKPTCRVPMTAATGVRALFVRS